MGRWLLEGGQRPASWRVQSAWFSRGVSCIMHGGCYFHHKVPSGVIVVPAPSAHIALCSQIVVWASTLTLSPHFLPLPSPYFIPRCPMEMALEDPVGSINWLCLQSGVYPGLKDGSLHKLSCLLSQRRMGKVALLRCACIISHSK